MSEETDNIYLTEKEILRLYKLKLENDPHLKNTRDLFIIGCYTGLRFEDLEQLHTDKFVRGVFLKVKPLKVDDFVIIPLHWMLKEILIKNKNELPRVISNQKMNEYLKEIGRMAKIDDIVVLNKTRGGKKVELKYKKFELITTHTARRSFATNSYLADMPSISIMKITGHKTEKAFLRYIKISQEDNALKLMNHPFFKKTKKSLAE